MKDTPAAEVIRGTVQRVTFRNPANGYSVLQVTLDDNPDRVTAVGICPQTRVGAHVMMTGTFVAHPKFGRQFHVISSTETPPSTVAGITRYLSSGLITGVGKKTAQRIVDEFGVTALEIIRSDPSRVAAVAGIGKKKAELLHTALAEQSEFDQIMRFLVEHHISPSLSAKIYERFRNKTVDVIQADPYILAREIRGIGFQTADSIALNLGVTPESPVRVRAGLYFALDSAIDEGHCYLTQQALLERSLNLLGIEDSSMLSEQLDYLISTGTLVVYEGGIFLKHLNHAEDLVASFVAFAHAVLPRKSQTEQAQ